MRASWSKAGTNPSIFVLQALTSLLLAAAFVFLQGFILGQAFVIFLVAYGLIGIAGVLSVLLPQSPSKPDLVCIGSTALFCGYIVLRALTSPVSYVARADLYSCLAAFVIYAGVATTLTNPNWRIGLITLLLTLALAHVWLGIIQFGVGENFALNQWLENLEISHRATGFYLNPDHLAGFLEVIGILGLSITCWSRWPKWARVMIGYLTAACYVGLALTGSRGGYNSAAVSLVIFALLNIMVGRAGGSAFYRKVGIGSLIALAIVLVAGSSIMSRSVHLNERLQTTFAIDAGRFGLWRAAIDQWKLQPFVGTGSGTYLWYGRQFRAERMQLDPVVAHNDYLHLLGEYGLIGFALFALFFGAHLYRGWKTFVRLGPTRISVDARPLGNRLALNIGALCAIAAYLVHSFVDFNMHIPANAILIAFVGGVIANAGPRTDNETAKTKAPLIPRLGIASLGALLLVQCVRLLPGQYYADEANYALQSEQPSQAIQFANKALKYEQQNPDVYFYLGRAQAALANQKADNVDASSNASAVSQRQAALAAFDTARRLSPLEEAYPLDMAYIYDQLGRYAEAEWMFSIARSLDPRSVNIGELYKTHLERWQNAAR